MLELVLFIVMMFLLTLFGVGICQSWIVAAPFVLLVTSLIVCKKFRESILK